MSYTFDLMMGVAYPVKNVEASYEFYSGKLGIRETFAGDGKTWAAMRVGEKMLMLVSAKELGAKPGFGAGAMFTVRDLDGAVAELKKRGITVKKTMKVPNGGRAAYFLDPDGNTVGMFEPPHGRVHPF
jgi:predicted enzyme related to lactoylglutathione lyase